MSDRPDPDLLNLKSTSLLNDLNVGYTLASVLAFAGIPSICIIYGKKGDVAKNLGLSWSVAAPACLLWGLIAFSMVFGRNIPTGVIGTDTYATVNKVGGGDYSFVYFSFMFAMTALSIIIAGAGTGMKTNAFQLFMMGSLLLNYCPLAFWFWNFGAQVGSEPGWAFKYGIIDYSGGIVLHGYAGTAVLILGLLSKHKRHKLDLSSPAAILACLGFFVGKQALQLSSGSSDGQISSLGAFNTIVGAYAGAMTFNVANVVLPREGGAGLFRGTVSASSTVKGALVGTVSIASSAAYVQPEYAVLSSVAASALVFVVDYLTKGVNVAGFDCFLMHGFSGFLGAALAGLFPSNRNFRLFELGSDYAANYVGAFFGNPMQLAKQFVGISFAILLTTVMTVGLYGLVHLVWLPFGGAWEDAPRHDANPVAAVSGPSRAVSGAESAAPLVE